MMNIYDNNKNIVGTSFTALEAFNVVNWLDRNAPESGPHYALDIEAVEAQIAAFHSSKRGFFARLFGK